MSITSSLKHLMSPVCLIVIASLASGCGKRYDEAIWTEEVKLHDGQMIQVWRRVTRQPSGFPIAPRGRELEVELKYPALNIYWKGDGTSQPLSFELFDGVPHMVLYARVSREWCKDKPDDEPLAQFLVWKQGQWREVAKDSFPVDAALANLYIRYWGSRPEDDASGQITWKTKAIQDSFYADAPYNVRGWYRQTSNYCRLYKMN